MTKKFYLFAILLMSTLLVHAQDNAKVEAMKAATAVLHDVACCKMDRFNWLTLNEVSKVFHPQNSRNLREQEKMFGNPEKEIIPILKANKENGTKVGINWKDIFVTDIRFKGEYDDEWGTEELKGYIFLKSGGKPYRIFFKRGFTLDGKWRFILLRSMLQTSEIPSDYPKSGRN